VIPALFAAIPAGEKRKAGIVVRKSALFGLRSRIKSSGLVWDGVYRLSRTMRVIV
jgi:hypothetical protein